MMVFLIGVFFCVFVVIDILVILFVILNFVKRGVLFKGGLYLLNFFDLKVVVFDKIGILI